MMAAKQVAADPQDLISTSVAAAVLGVNPLTVRRWADQGRLSARRVGPLLVLSRDEVEALARARQTPQRHGLSPSILRVLEALADASSVVTANQLSESTEQNAASVWQYLSILRVRGLAVRVGRARVSGSGPPPRLWAATAAGRGIVAERRAV